MKKILSKMLVVLFAALCLGGAVPALAAEEEVYYPVPVAEIEMGSEYTVYTEAEPRAEEVGWVFRENTVTGQWQKRLWSYTYGEWLTDWIDCERSI